MEGKETEGSMVIVMEQHASEEQIQKVIESLVEVGYDVHRSTGVSHTVLGAVGSPRQVVDPTALELIPGVREVVKISEPYKLVGRTFKPADTTVDVAGGSGGGGGGHGGRAGGHRNGRPLLGGDARPGGARGPLRARLRRARAARRRLQAAHVP